MPKPKAPIHREVCRNCGKALYGLYCSACGQPEREGHPPTIRHFLHDLSHEVLHLDGKVFRTLAALLFQPGKLTEEYWAGRVFSWIRPIRIFLAIIFLHVLVSSGQGPLNHRITVAKSYDARKVNIANGLLDSETISTYIPWYAAKMEGELASGEERETFDHEFAKAYAVIRYASVLSFALVAWLLYHRQQPWFVSHLIAGLHFFSFWYLLALVASLPGRINPVWNDLSILASVYLYLSLGRLFAERWYVQLAKTAFLYLFVHLTELGLGYAAARWIEG